MNYELLALLSIPATSALVGWGTNVLALKMTFHPLDFVGVPPYLGWQGIIPAKAVSMASRTVELMTTRLVGVQEVIDRLDAERVTEELARPVGELIRDVIDTVMTREQPALWTALPDVVKDQIYERARAEAPEVVRQSLIDLKIDIDEVLDLEQMAIAALLEDRRLLNRIFLECGREEFAFIERSGLYFGGLFGLFVMALWYFFPSTWLLPAVGFLVGWLTNFLALKMIFEPTNPVKLGPFTWQGSFLKRQEEVSEAYARLVATNVVSARNILRTLFDGPGTERLLAIIQKHVQEAADSYEAAPRTVTNFLLGSAQYETLKHDIGRAIVRGLPSGPMDAIEGYASEALDLENTLKSRLEELPPEQFTGLLRPIFQEDEWKLVLVGAVLGGVVGFGQMTVLL